MLSGIIFGIIPMICWGIGDFLSAGLTKKIGPLRTATWVQSIALVIYLCIFTIFFRTIDISSIALFMVLATGLVGTIAYLNFFKGLQEGKASVISPLTACWGIITVVLSVILFQEKLVSIKVIGVALAILGGVLTSIRFHDIFKLKLKEIEKGVLSGIIALLLYGVFFTMTSVLVKEIGWFLPIFLINIFRVPILQSWTAIKYKIKWFPKKAIYILIIIAIFEAVAFLSYGYGVSSNYTSIIAPITATSPVIVIILARIFTKETLEWSQIVGIISAISGIVLLSL